MSAMTELVARLPWVTRLSRAQACDGYRWSHMPLAALDSSASIARFRCKARARWKFTALPDTLLAAPSGTYCWQHLLVMLWHNPDEEDRTIRALRELREADEKAAAP